MLYYTHLVNGNHIIPSGLRTSKAYASRERQSAALGLIHFAVLGILWLLSALPLLFVGTRKEAAGRLWLQPPFYDFGCYYDRMKLLHTPQFWTANAGSSWDYPAPGVFIYKMFYAFNRGSGASPHRVFFGFLSYLIFAGLVIALASVLIATRMQRAGVSRLLAWSMPLLSLLLCWPIFFALQRGNIELFADTGLALGVLSYARKRWWLTATIFGVFGTVKLYPLLLLLLLVPERKWKEFACGVAVAVVVSSASASYIGPAPMVVGRSPGVLSGIRDWIQANSLQLDLHLSGYDHSLYGLVKLLAANHRGLFTTLAVLYGVAIAAVCLAVLCRYFFQLPRLNRLLLLCFAAVLLPPTSFDYTLQLLVPAWMWLLINACSREPVQVKRRWDLAIFIAFALLFAPETFVVVHGIMIAGQLKAFALVVLVVAAIKRPFMEDPAPMVA